MFDSPHLTPRRRAAAVAAVLIGVAGLALLYGPGRSSDAARPVQPAPAPGLPVVALTLHGESGYTVAQRYVGRVVSRRDSRLGFTQGGLLAEVLVDEGDAVAHDQVLARLDTAHLLAALRELEARVAEIEARLALARLTLDRTRKLAGQDSVSQQQYDESRFAESALRAQLASARAGIERVDVDLARAELRAPFAGRIVARSADEGTIVSPGQPVLQLIESAHMEARVGVPPEVATTLAPGSRHVLVIEGMEAEAQLTAILDEVMPDTRTVTVILRLDESPTPVRHGALARLTLASERQTEGFWLPITALSESRRGLWAALVLLPEPDHDGLHRVDRREVSLIHTESDHAFVRGTLSDGERVVASGVHRLVPGQLVRLDDAAPAAAVAAR